MAAGALVPHVLPSGRTIMVPAHLAGQGSGALAMPSAPMPQGPDMRVAGPGGGLSDPNSGDPMAAARLMESLQPTPQEKQIAEMRAKLSAPQGPGANEHPTKPSQPGWMPSGQARPGGAVDPSTLAKPRTAAPAQEGKGDEWNPLVRQVFNESRGGGGGPRRTGVRQEASATVERTPGRDMLPEYKWATGLEARPDFGDELDPNAPFDAENPAMRARKTGLERGAESAGTSARAAYQQEELQQHALYNAQRESLLGQSQLLDENLAAVAKRRERIAALQETADKRMEEAKSFEPRTREQIWQEKGPAAQVMGLLAMAIGGYTQGLGRNGGRNPGLDIINKVLDDAVESDRYKAEKRTKVGMAAKNDYEHALALYGDQEAAALETKNRKLANVMAMTQNMLADRGLDQMSKQRGEQMYAAAQQQYLENAQQLYDRLNGVAVKESISYKPEMAGGGGGGMDTLARLERAARAKKATDAITGEGGGAPTRSIEGDKLNDVNAAMESLDAADAVERDVRALGVEGSDFDDPTSGPIDAAARIFGTGGDGRRKRQSLEANTKRMARGIQQSLGKSDNDAKLADEMAIGDGSGLGRVRAAETARKQALGRIQTATAGMTPQQREAFLQALPPERREQLRGAMAATASPRRASSEAKAE